MDAKDTLSMRLERLFEHVRKPNGARYTQKEVVQGTHGVLTRVYLWKLRTGRATNPGYHIIKALADFFHVDTDYFAGRDETPSEKAIPNVPGRFVQEIMARASQMDDKSQKAILDLMDYLISLKESED
jgi:transcriptional regulator with XRE-family HTH domain